MNLVIALVLASAPALAFSPYDVTVTDGPTVAPSKSPTFRPTDDPTAAPTWRSTSILSILSVDQFSRPAAAIPSPIHCT
jgi:hypothetical protein